MDLDEVCRRLEVDGLSHRSGDELSQSILRLARRKAPEDLSVIVEVANYDGCPGDEFIYSKGIVALPAWGPEGLEMLALLASGVSSVSVGTQALYVLGRLAARAQPRAVTVTAEFVDSLNIETTPELQRTARQILNATVQDLLSTDGVSRHRLFAALHMISILEHEDALSSSEIVEAIGNVRVPLNQTVLGRFSELLAARESLREEDYQMFLASNPVLLDPLAARLWIKPRLGAEWIPDFVVRRLDNEYMIVEIEHPRDTLFITDSSPTKHLRVALSQVRDYSHWVKQNLAYARNEFPEILDPTSLVVIGMRSEMSSRDVSLLRSENSNRLGTTRIVTYDDLLLQAKVVLQNVADPGQPVAPMPAP